MYLHKSAGESSSQLDYNPPSENSRYVSYATTSNSAMAWIIGKCQCFHILYLMGNFGFNGQLNQCVNTYRDISYRINSFIFSNGDLF